MKELLTDERPRTLEGAPTISSTSSITPSLTTYVSRTQPDNGWCWLGHEQLKRVEQFLEKKARPSVRSVLLAYAQLSSRKGNARSFPAAARLVATMAGVAVSTLHEADAKLASLGLIQIRQRKDERGLDAPRMVTLCDELPELGASAWELVTADELKQTAAATRRRRSDSGVRLGSARERQGGHTKETLKEIPKQTTLSPSRRPQAPARESWEEVEERLAKENGMELADVRHLRETHETNMAKLTSGAYATPENFTRNFSSLKAKRAKHESRLARYRGVGDPSAYASPAEKASMVQAAVQRAMAERTNWWRRYAANAPHAPQGFEEADAATRLEFMQSNEGANFANLAASIGRDGKFFSVEDETGVIRYDAPPKPTTPPAAVSSGSIRNRTDLLYDGTGEW